MALEPDIEKLAEEIKSCKNIVTALGDESRQHLIIAMMQACNCNGLRVGEITERTNLKNSKYDCYLNKRRYFQVRAKRCIY